MLAALDRRYDVRPGLLLALSLLFGANLVIGVLSLARANGGGDSALSFCDVVTVTGVMLASYALLFWLVVWLEETQSLHPGIALGATLLVGGILSVVSLMVLVSVIRKAGAPKRRSSSVSTWLTDLGPGFIFWLSLGYLAALMGLALAFSLVGDRAREEIGMIGGILPVGVPWFGALGAVTVSLYGVFRHIDEWQPKWNPWHIARPLVGAVLGMIAFFIIFGIAETTTADTARVAGATTPGLILYYVVAFVAGYREDSFRDLIRRTADVLLKPSGFEDGGSIDITPTGSVAYGEVPPGEQSEVVDFQITNRSGKSLAIPPDGVSFIGQQHEEWDWEQSEAEGRTWWDGSMTELANGTTLWVRTAWTPSEDAMKGSQHQTVLSISFSGNESPPKTVRLYGLVGRISEDEE